MPAVAAAPPAPLVEAAARAARPDPGLVEAGQPVQKDGRDGQPSSAPSQPPGPATEVGIRLLDAPVDRRDDSRAHKYVVDHVRPGTVIKRRIVVKNPSKIRRPVAVYAAAAEVDRKGFVLAPGRAENELSSWISVERGGLKLDPGEEAVLRATITVPERASAGERYAVVWAEVSGVDGQNVRNIGRAGIRVYLSVGPGGEPPSSFDIGTLGGTRDPDGAPVVTADVRNTGRRALDLAGQLWLSDGPGGLSAGPVRVEAKTLAPGDSTSMRIVLDRRLPDGPWSAKLELASGWTKREATGQVTFGANAAVTTGTDRTGQVLTGGLVASGLVLALLAAFAYRRRGRVGAAVPAA
ncbi:hypothetical protein [Micromonospora okii]|uniref:hypothetical protein n=1 Tax=Micromonospora okii TaxID=1182970 RepID=UPI001E424195|nr:hypothetical protein [Micromonospora okii]